VLRGERVTPTQASKSSEIVVGRADFCTMFYRDCSEMGIQRKIATGFGIGQEIEEQLKNDGGPGAIIAAVGCASHSATDSKACFTESGLGKT
jgi:hypothetical protein